MLRPLAPFATMIGLMICLVFVNLYLNTLNISNRTLIWISGFCFLQAVARMLVTEMAKDPYDIKSVFVACTPLAVGVILGPFLNSGVLVSILILLSCLNGIFYLWTAKEIISQFCDAVGAKHWWSIVPDTSNLDEKPKEQKVNGTD